MSDTYVRIIPVDPTYVPSATARERALGVLQQSVPLADDIVGRLMEDVRFVDCGANFETVRCPMCGADVGEWWAFAMETGQDMQFRDLRVTTPCCGVGTSLNDLAYSWPAGFARYTLEALNPGVDQLPEAVLRRVERTLGGAVRIIWAHY